MEAIRKQARQLREQVAKQQQAVLRQFSGRFGPEIGNSEDADVECHQKLKTLYQSTRAAKHFQKNIVRGIEGTISANAKQMEIGTKLVDDCYKYGSQNPDSFLAAASDHFGNSHMLIEKEKEKLLKVLGDQVYETLRAMITSAPLEDARHLTYRYERIRQDVESQAIEVARRRLKSRDATANAETMAKLEFAESRLSELKSALEALGREATTAMASVETQQEETTFQQLLTMVEAERSFHENAAVILTRLYTKMVEEKQQAELASMREEPDAINVAPIAVKTVESYPTSTKKSDVTEMATKPAESHLQGDTILNGQSDFFIAEVVHPFDAQADGELSLLVGDFVVVRKVLETGWSEGECKGNAGWFPSAYVLQRDKVPASKLLDPSSPEISYKSP